MHSDTGLEHTGLETMKPKHIRPARTSTVGFWKIAATFLGSAMPLAFGSAILHAQLETGWKAHDLRRPAPAVVTPASEDRHGGPPSDAIILFDGTDLKAWRDNNDGDADWEIQDGVLVAKPKAGYIFTRENFGDCQLHVEWAIPDPPKQKGQSRGNSGVFLMGVFEVQVLDSFNNHSYADGGAGAVYGQHPPLVNASRKPRQWQTYDIIFNAPKFDGQGKLTDKAQLTLLHNGVLVQHNSQIMGPTNWIRHGWYKKNVTQGPIALQDHDSPVKFRNIWVRRIEPREPANDSLYPVSDFELSDSQRKELAGNYRAFRIAEKNDRLYCHFVNVRLTMLPISEDEFVFEKAAGKLTIERNEQGDVTGATLLLDAGGKRVGKRKPDKKTPDKKTPPSKPLDTSARGETTPEQPVKKADAPRKSSSKNASDE